MSGLFGSKTYDDPELGTLTRSWRHWKVSIQLPPHGDVAVRIAGSRSGPDADGLALARQLVARYPELMPAIEEELFEHYEPYGDESARSEAPGDAPPRIDTASEVWPHVSIDEVLIGPLAGELDRDRVPVGLGRGAPAGCSHPRLAPL